jgi:hypothetical protein
LEAAAKVLAPIFYKKNSKKPPQSLKKRLKQETEKNFKCMNFQRFQSPAKF